MSDVHNPICVVNYENYVDKRVVMVAGEGGGGVLII